MEESTNRKRNNAWLLLLLAPVLGLVFPSIYNHEDPALFGFPFFYWYQFAWVFGSALLLAFVYKKVKY